MKKLKPEIDWVYSRLWLAIAVVAALLASFAYYWLRDIQQEATRKKPALIQQNNEAQNTLGSFHEWSATRLVRARAVSDNYKQIAFDEVYIRQVIARAQTKWREAEQAKSAVAMGLSQVRSRQVWGDTVVADWLAEILPSLIAWEANNSPIGVESITIRTRGSNTQRSFDRVEVVLTGIAR